jgi:ubiquinone/menaquinone biosynthesis C-methylase UbiE
LGDSNERLLTEAAYQDQRMAQALQGQPEFRDRFYFVNRLAYLRYLDLHRGLRGKRVVVVGSSDAGVTPLAREEVYVEGIDISPGSIEKLNRSIESEGLGKYASARVMDAHDLEYPDNSIDVITCSGVLHHLDTERALASWSRCIKRDGTVLLFEPLAFHPLAALFRLVTPTMRTPDEHPLRPRDFRLMRKYFGSVNRSDFGLTTPVSAGIAMIPGLQRLSERTLPAFEFVDSISLKIAPVLRHICWLTVIRLRQPLGQ